jgi:hypothetical protein
VACFDNPELTFSARILRSMIDQGIGGTGRALAAEYREMLMQEPLEILSEADFVAEREASVVRQKEVEAADTSRLRRFWRSTPDKKKKATSLWPKYISEFRDDDNKCASFIYSDSHSVEEFSLF